MSAADGAQAGEPGGEVAGHVALCAVQVCFGLFPVFGAIAMRPGVGFDPFAVAVWRVAVGALCLGGAAWWLCRERMRIARGDLGLFFLCSTLGIAANQGISLAGLQRSTPMNAGLLICLIPIFTFVVAVVAGHERFGWLRAAGVAVAFAGSLPLFLGRGAEVFGEHALGNLLLATNALCYGVYLVFSKPLTRRYPPLVVIAWMYGLSLVWLPAFAWGRSLWPEVSSAATWGSMAYVLVFATVVSYLLNTFALSRVPASTTAFYIYAQPLITGCASALIVGEQPAPGMGLAALGLFVGVALVTRRPGGPRGSRTGACTSGPA